MSVEKINVKFIACRQVCDFASFVPDGTNFWFVFCYQHLTPTVFLKLMMLLSIKSFFIFRNI